MEKAHPVGFARREKPNCLWVDECHVVQIQDGSSWLVTDRRSQCLEVFRSNSAAQTKDLRRSTRNLVDPERHLPMLMLARCKLGASGDLRESLASLLVRAVRSAIGVVPRHSVGN